MGKVLIEKLLWSCPEIETIYLLLRPKKGVQVQERLIQLENLQVFERLRNRDPQIFQRKVKVVDGDITELKLGLSDEHRQLLINTVSIIYHVAASVRFDDSLKFATIMNARGTRELMLLAREIKNIQLVLHVSTTYCNTDKSIIEEKLYPPHGDWETTIKMVETIDEETVKILTAKYIGELPNTYVFTKSLGEHIVNDLRGDIPAVICRPSIVVSSIDEPLPGWVDNFNGPVGLLVACGKGIMRSMYASKEAKIDVIPVDIAVKGFILATWKYAVLEKKHHPVVPVVNCAAAQLHNLSYHKIIAMGLEFVHKMPMNGIFWVPGGGLTKYKILHITSFILFHLLPAFVADVVLKLSGNKPILWRLQRRIYVASKALHHYIENEWLFKNDEFLTMRKLLLPQDVNDFDYPTESIDVRAFLKISMMGARRYLLKESDDTIPQAQIHYNRMYYLDKALKIIFLMLLIKFLYSSFFVKNCISDIFM